MSNGPIDAFVEDLDQTALTDLVLIVAKQDPTESKEGGGARWNENQRKLILASQEVIEEEGLSD